MTDELKPCPFCGHGAGIHQNSLSVRAYCYGCGGQTDHAFYESQDELEAAIKRATQEWNERYEDIRIAKALNQLNIIQEHVVRCGGSTRSALYELAEYAKNILEEPND